MGLLLHRVQRSRVPDHGGSDRSNQNYYVSELLSVKLERSREAGSALAGGPSIRHQEDRFYNLDPCPTFAARVRTESVSESAIGATLNYLDLGTKANSTLCSRTDTHYILQDSARKADRRRRFTTDQGQYLKTFCTPIGMQELRVY